MKKLYIRQTFTELLIYFIHRQMFEVSSTHTILCGINRTYVSRKIIFLNPVVGCESLQLLIHMKLEQSVCFWTAGGFFNLTYLLHDAESFLRS